MVTHPEIVPIRPNQIVAYNLRRARELRGWTMEEAARRLEPHSGTLWSKATFSAAERSLSSPERIRQFTADDLVAFALTFHVPIWWFFMPPPANEQRGSEFWVWQGEVGEDGFKALPMPLLVELILGTGGLRERLAEVFGDDGNPGYPLEEQTEVQKRARDLADLVAMAAMRSSLTELPKWATDLRQLANTLDAVSEQAEQKAIDQIQQRGKKKGQV